MPQSFGIIQRRFELPRPSGYPWHRVSTMARNRCPAWIGITVQHPSESVSTMDRNQCPACVGLCNAEFTPTEAAQIENKLDEILETAFGEINELLESDPYAAYMRLTQLTALLNSAIPLKTGILRRLEKWIKKFADLLEKLTKKLNGAQFSIGAGGWPPSLSIEITFTV